MSIEPASSNNSDGILGEFSKTRARLSSILDVLGKTIATILREPFKGLKNSLISFIAVLVILFNPIWGEGVIGLILGVFDKKISDFPWLQNLAHSWGPYLLIGAFLIALALSVWEQLTRRPAPPPQFRNPAIKGLLSFEQSDAEIYKKLQREVDVQQVMSAITYQRFRFGVLTGVSGCGKSSLLKAGLLPAMAERGYKVAIATLNDEQPLESIEEALGGQLGVQFSSMSPNLQEMLNTALQSTGATGLTLILDQFEQFFTQNREEAEREPFIRELLAVYLNNPKVRILLSIRLDFAGRLHEILKTLQCSLTPDQNYFDLKKFKPQQAVRIFCIMSEEGGVLSFDEEFMLEMTRTELASKEDGLVSAADVQWVALALQQAEGLTFDKPTFQQLGGVQGMMQQYLQKLLATPNPFNLNQESLKILLAFVDLDNNTRLGRLSATDLRRKIGDQLADADLADNLLWLEQNRLLYRPGNTQTGSDSTWELAHERLIEPLRILANKALTGLDQANLLLNRRVNEWLANNRSTRFLLSRKEYYRLRKNAAYVLVEPNKVSKEELWQGSKDKVRVWNRLALAAFAVLLSLVVVYETTWFKVQMLSEYYIKRIILKDHAGKNEKTVDMLDSLYRVNARYALEIAEGLGREEKSSAYETIWKNLKSRMIEDSSGRSEIAGLILPLYADTVFLRVADSLSVLLTDALPSEKILALIPSWEESSEKIQDLTYRVNVLHDLANASVKLRKPEKALIFLQKAAQSAQGIQSADSRASALMNLVQTAGQINNVDLTVELLNQANESAQKIDVNAVTRTFDDLAKTAGKLQKSDQVLDFFQRLEAGTQNIKYGALRIDVLCTLAQTTYDWKKQDMALGFLRKAEQIVQKEDRDARVGFFCNLAQVANKLNSRDMALDFFSKAERSMQRGNDQNYNAHNFSKLAQTASKLGEKALALDFLQKEELCVLEIKDYYFKALDFSLLSQDVLMLENQEKAIYFAQHAVQIAIESDDDMAFRYVFSGLRSTFEKFSNSEIVFNFLDQTRQSVQKIKYGDGTRGMVYNILIECATKLDRQELALTFFQKLELDAQEISSERYRASILGRLAQVVAKTKNRELVFNFLQKLEQSAQKIRWEDARVDLVIELAQAAIKTKNQELTFDFLQKLEQSAQKIRDEDARADFVSELAKAAASLKSISALQIQAFLRLLDSYHPSFEAKSHALATYLGGLSEAYATFGELRKAYNLADEIQDKYPEKVFALIHLQKCRKERQERQN